MAGAPSLDRPSDRSGAESAVRRLYRAAGFDEPQHFVWFDSPFAASWAVALLVAPSHFSWGQKLSSAALSAQDRQRVAAARSRLQQELGIADWDHVLKAAGGPLGAGVQFPPGARSDVLDRAFRGSIQPVG